MDLVNKKAAIDALISEGKTVIVDSHYLLAERIINESDAVEAISMLPSVEPEAKPPKWVAEDRYVKNHFKVFPHCPQCNAEVKTEQCYCMICGQHIDWSEDGE